MSNPISWEAEVAFRYNKDRGGPDTVESPVRILVTGSRNWTDEKSVAKCINVALKFFESEASCSTLIHGNARGADKIAAGIADDLGLTVESHPAHWNVHNKNCPRVDPKNGGCWKGRDSCKRAGFRRNIEMISSGANILLAFIKDDSPGASGTLNLWLQEDRPVIICRQSGDNPVKGEFINMNRYTSKSTEGVESGEA